MKFFSRLRQKIYNNRADSLAIFFLAVWPLIYNWQAALRQAVFTFGDIFLFFYPTHRVYAEALREFRLPLWTPEMLAGFPLYAEGQIGALYPTHPFLYGLLPIDLATNYDFRTQAIGRFAVGADANVPFNFKARTSPTGQYYQYARNFTDGGNGKGNQQGVIPNYAIKAHLNYAYKDLTAGVGLSYLPALNAPGTAFGEVPGTANGQRADGKTYTVPSYANVNLSATYRLPGFGREWAKGFVVTAGVNNVFDKAAPFVPGSGNGGGTEANTAKYAYDIIGRFMFIELKKEF